MWTIAAVNKKFDGPLGTYNGLTDVHLAHYFSRPSRQSHLKAAKLITGDGTIIPEQKVKVASLQYERQKQIYDMLASTIIQNAAHKEGSWNKKLRSYLEDVLKMENVEAIKVKKNKSFKNCSNLHPFKHFNICGWFRGKNNEHASTFPRSVSSACKCHTKNCASSLHSSISKLKRCFSAKEDSPYVVFNSSHKNQSRTHLCQTASLQKKKKRKRTANSVVPQNTSLENTASSKITKLCLPANNFNIDHCKVTLFYHGHTPLANAQHVKENILIKQQHCGGTPIIVYKGQIAPNEAVRFIIQNHEDFTFSLTVFLDGIRYLKLSSCCVFRYHRSRRLGGSNGVFSIQNIEGGKSCLRCEYRQIETCSKDLKTKLICSETDGAFKADELNDFPSHFEGKAFEIASRNENIEMHDSKNSSEIEDAGNSVESEVINSLVEDIEENVVEVFENTNSLSDNETIEDEIAVENQNVIFDENFKDATDSSSESESSVHSAAESVKHFTKSEDFQAKPYASGSSSEDDNGRRHVILASVHGSPSASN